jgi:hypothetical protein
VAIKEPGGHGQYYQHEEYGIGAPGPLMAAE